MTMTPTNGHGVARREIGRPFTTTPLYTQVQDRMRERISTGEWKPNMAIPNEGDLAREFGVSSGTMRKALDALEAEGFLSRKQGRGTFVCGLPAWEDLSAEAKAMVALLTQIAPDDGGISPSVPTDRMLVQVDAKGKAVKSAGAPLGYTSADLAILAQGASDLRVWLEMRAAKAGGGA
jgi:DNA-binding transcriptional regulator YhcF (GntR family)